MSDFYQRVGETGKQARDRVRGKQVKRIAKSHEESGRPDLAQIVLATASPSILPGAQYVTLEIVCSAKHYDGAGNVVPGGAVAARMRVDTYARYRDFDSAWGSQGEGPGVWQSFGREDTWSSTATDGHICWHVRCRRCMNVTEIKGDRLASMFREIWSVGATTKKRWRP